MSSFLELRGVNHPVAYGFFVFYHLIRNNSMKNFIVFLFCLFALQSAAQNKDSVLYSFQGLTLVKHLDNERYDLTFENGKEFKDLYFAKSISQYHQVLDKDFKMYFVSRSGEVKDSVEDYMGVCGTVPHFEMRINKKNGHFEVMEDETFYDSGNKEAAVLRFEVPFEDADSVLFINGKSEFNFTANFGVGPTAINPRMIILCKNGKYSSLENPKLQFDAIDFESYGTALRTEKDGHYGFYGILDPMFSELSKFNYYLAQATLPSGEEVFIDTEGKRYFRTIR